MINLNSLPKKKRDRLEELHGRYLPEHYRFDQGAFQWAIVDDGSVTDCWWYNMGDAKRGTFNYKECSYDSEFPFDDSKIIIMSLF